MPPEIVNDPNKVVESTGAVRSSREGKGRFDLIDWAVIQDLAKHFENGAKYHPERNWERGIPLSRYFDSAVRHLSNFARGLTDEPHLLAAFWNIHCLISTQRRIHEGRLPQELDDFPPSGSSLAVPGQFFPVSNDCLSGFGCGDPACPACGPVVPAPGADSATGLPG